MAFFRNDTVNLLNLHYGIHALAMSGGGAFFAAFLLRAGVPAPAVLAAIALIVAGRFVIRPLCAAPPLLWRARRETAGRRHRTTVAKSGERRGARPRRG
jgi:hypothetical protein